MFGKINDMMKQVKLMQKLMKDENFRTLISHPKVQELLKDKQFQDLITSQNMGKIATHPKLTALMRDPEVGPLLKKIDPKALLQA